MSIYVREPGDWKESWVNFKPDEFRCSHCGALEVHEDLVDLLQEAREALGTIAINSCYRCPAHNSNVSTPTVFDIQQTNINSDYINNYYTMSKISNKNIKSVGPRGFKKFENTNL